MSLIVIYYLAKINSHSPGGSIYSGYKILICHVSLQDHVTKRSCDFMEESHSFYINIGNYGCDDITHLICHVTLQHHVVSI